MGGVNRPLVSVIIPTYNRIQTLPASIESVLNQTYGNLEVIIMDDASEDGTEEYVKGMEDNRIRYRKSGINMGPAAARNLGAELATGEYLAFQDSDDEWLPDKLEKQMELMLKDEELSLVYCEFGMYQGEELRIRIPFREIPYDQKCGDLFSYLLLYPLISTQTMVVKREAFLEEQGFNETLKAYEDFEFTLRFSRRNRIGFVEETLVRVNSSPDSVNKRFAERSHAQFFMAREMLEPLRERDLLWQKLEIILQEAELHLCHDTFIDDLTQFSKECLSGEERQYAQLFLEKIERSKEIILLKMHILERMPVLKASILKIYAEIYKSKSIWSDQQRRELECLRDILQGCGRLFEIPAEILEQYSRICQKMEDSHLKWTDQLFLLTDMAGLLEPLEKLIRSSRQ